MHSNKALEKAMATHSSILAWKISWMEEPDRLQSMGSLSVGQDWMTSLSLFTFMHWRRKWHPTPVLLPGESQEWRSLVGCCLQGHTESDTTEATQQQQQQSTPWNKSLTHFAHFFFFCHCFASATTLPLFFLMLMPFYSKATTLNQTDSKPVGLIVWCPDYRQ